MGPFVDFVDRTIVQAPLTGTAAAADKSTVHQLILSFTTGESSETWVKPVLRFKYGRKSMEALRNHFTGEGNSSRRIPRVKKLKENLFYKTEATMPFETFLTRCQEMFNIFEKHDEALSPEAKLRFLFSKIRNTGLDSAAAAMKVKIATEPSKTVTYITITNHLSTDISELPENKRSQNISTIAAGT